MFKVNIGQVLSIVALAQQLVSTVQDKMHGATGAEKKKAVMDGLLDALKLVEASTGKDLLNDTAVKELLDDIVEAEVKVMKLREKFQAVIASAGGKG